MEYPKYGAWTDGLDKEVHMSMLILTRDPMSGKRLVLTAKADPKEEREGSGVRIPGCLRLISQEYCLSSTTPLRRYGVLLSVQLESGNKAHTDCARLGLADCGSIRQGSLDQAHPLLSGLLFLQEYQA